MHRAMLSLMVAAGLTYAMYESQGAAWLYLISLPLWIAGVYFVVRGRQQLLRELRQRERS